MESHASWDGRFGNLISPGSMNEGFVAGEHAVHCSPRLQELESGKQQFVRFDRKHLLEKISFDIGDGHPPVFSVVHCGDDIFKCSIQIDLTSLNRINGLSGRVEIIEGGTFLSHDDARESALYHLFMFLDANYMMKINDFSSRSIRQLERCMSFHILDKGLVAAQHLLSNFDMVASHCKEFEASLLKNQFSSNFGGPCSIQGRVYAVLADDISSILEKVCEKANEVRADLNDIIDDRNFYEQSLKDKLRTTVNEVPYHEFDLPSKIMLDRVLSYYGLQKAQFINSFDLSGNANSKCVFTFPLLSNLQFGGTMEIPGVGYCSAEAEEDSAYQALLFLEKHFLTKIRDYNFPKRQKVIKSQKKLCSMVSRTIVVGDQLKRLFGKLLSVIQGKLGLFSFDPSTFFSGPMSNGQIEAFHFSGSGLSAVHNYSTDLFAACDADCQALHQLTWQLTAAESILPD